MKLLKHCRAMEHRVEITTSPVSLADSKTEGTNPNLGGLRLARIWPLPADGGIQLKLHQP